MPSSNRASSNDSRNLVILLLIVIGGFLAFCGLGMSSPLVIALGVIVAAAGPVMIMVVNNRNKVRLYVHGTAVVEEITARPTQEGRSARGRLKLTITATGIRGVTVTGTDPAIPVDKWPERGATLPVQVLKGTPRKFTVLWDRVQTHQEVVLTEQRRPADDVGGDDYSALNAHHNGARAEAADPDDAYRRPMYLPPDNTPTLTDLPPVEAGIEEPAGARVGAPVATVAPPGEQIPDAARTAGRRSRFGFPLRQNKPRHAAGDPSHHAAEPLGAAATATTFTAPAAPEIDTETTATETAATDGAEAITTSRTEAEATPEPEAITTTEPEPITTSAEPEPEAEPEFEAIDDIEPPAKGQTIIGEEDEPIIMRLRSTPRPGGGQHRRPSPHPRGGAHERVRRNRPGRTRPVTPEPPALPEPTAVPEAAVTEAEPVETQPVETEPTATETATATEAVTTEPVEIEASPEVYTIPESGSMVPAPQLDTDAGTAAEVEWWTGPDEARPAAAYYPDRESELPPFRSLHVEPSVIEGELAEPEAEPVTAEEPTARAEAVEAVEESPPATGSAWSANGKGPVPVGAGLYSAPPAFRPAAPDDEDDEEPVAPDPYATEHYVPADEATGDETEDADALEEQPLSEGAVAEFLAAGPRRQQAMPLDGVNGVSITLIVSDLQRSRRFYRDTLGLTELDSGETSAVLESGSARVVLRRVADMPPVDRRVVHLNLDVPDVYDAYERLREQGVDFVHRPRVVPQGEQLELCSATFRDPDGHAIALTRWELRR
ncbi:VOC family protein [Dactylosporangium sp. NPDC049140]|uniref:VOC family protein n=1 Tax=Dactylosporangium sp. NPDC049140 TaxID=3155647 RepID=UPI00340AC10C